MKHYSKYINPYMEKILNNEIEHCREQEDMINNIVIPVLERDDVYIDEKKIEDLVKELNKLDSKIKTNIHTN